MSILKITKNEKDTAQLDSLSQGECFYLAENECNHLFLKLRTANSSCDVKCFNLKVMEIKIIKSQDLVFPVVAELTVID